MTFASLKLTNSTVFTIFVLMNTLSLKDLEHIRAVIATDYGYRFQKHNLINNDHELRWVNVSEGSKTFTGIGVYPGDDFDSSNKKYIYSNYNTNSPKSNYRTLVSFELTGLCFYNNLELKLNTSWLDEMNPDYQRPKDWKPSFMKIYGEYKFIPIKLFSDIHSYIRIGMYHWNRLNKKYLELKEELPIKNQEFLDQLNLKNKNKIIAKRLKDAEKDFK